MTTKSTAFWSTTTVPANLGAGTCLKCSAASRRIWAFRPPGFDGDQADPRNFNAAQYETRVQGLVEAMEANDAKEGELTMAISELLKNSKKYLPAPKTMLAKYKGQGKKVIGCLPYYVPEELVYAAGMVPMGIWGSNGQTADPFQGILCNLLLHDCSAVPRNAA